MQFDIEHMPELFDRLKGLKDTLNSKEQEDTEKSTIMIVSSFVGLHSPLDKAHLRNRINGLGNYCANFIITSFVPNVFDGVSGEIEKVFDNNPLYRFIPTRPDCGGYLVRYEEKFYHPICAVNEIFPEVVPRQTFARMVSIGDFGAEGISFPNKVEVFLDYLGLLTNISSAVVNSTLKLRNSDTVNVGNIEKMVLPVNFF